MERRFTFQLMRPLLVALVLVALASLASAWNFNGIAYGRASVKAQVTTTIVMDIDTIGTEPINTLQMSMTNTVSNPTGNGLAAGKVQVSAVTIAKDVSKLTPKIVRALTTGAHIKTVTFTFYDAAGKSSKMITLSNVLVTGYARFSNSNTDTEQDSFSYTKIAITVDGITTVYDVAQNKADGATTTNDVGQNTVEE
ncbi:type VI secretion system tube protein Hcp [Dictyobacter kobayashii]|nr:type VI secretion system tube protein Hcp [Dictyobacter kobayashii]